MRWTGAAAAIATAACRIGQFLEDQRDDHRDLVREPWTTLFAAEIGSGPPIVLMHGGLANHQSCLLWAAPLAARLRIIAPDLRGSGRSCYARPLDWDLLADDVAALVRHLGLARVAIGGTSFGAGVAVRTALRHPDLTAALLVLQPAFGGAELGLTPAQHAAMQAMAAAGSRTLRDGIAALDPLFDALPAEIRERARSVVAGADPASVATTTQFLVTAGQPFATGGDLAAISVPTLVVPGDDPTHPIEVAEVYRRHLPRCHVGSAHAGGFAPAIVEVMGRVAM